MDEVGIFVIFLKISVSKILHFYTIGNAYLFFIASNQAISNICKIIIKLANQWLLLSPP